MANGRRNEPQCLSGQRSLLTIILDYSDPNAPVDMSADELPDAPFRRLFDHWSSWDGANGVPYRDQLDPANIPRLLQNVMLVEQLANGEFFYRVVGTHIVDAVEFDPSMKPMSAMPDYVDTVKVSAAFQTVIDLKQPRFERMTGQVFAKRWNIYRRLLLPLADTNGKARYILGCVSGEAQK